MVYLIRQISMNVHTMGNVFMVFVRTPPAVISVIVHLVITEDIAIFVSILFVKKLRQLNLLLFFWLLRKTL